MSSKAKLQHRLNLLNFLITTSLNVVWRKFNYMELLQVLLMLLSDLKQLMLFIMMDLMSILLAMQLNIDKIKLLLLKVSLHPMEMYLVDILFKLKGKILIMEMLMYELMEFHVFMSAVILIY